MQKYFKFVIFSLLLIIFGSGCYTIFKHPGEEKNYSANNGETDCVRCHPYYHDNFGTTHYYYPDYWSTYDRFGSYYAEPWWWDYYWYDNTNRGLSEDDSSNPRSSGGERVTRSTDQNINNDAYLPTITRGPSGGSSSSSSGTTATKTADESSQTKAETKTRSDTENNTSSKTKEPKADKKATKKSGRMKKQ